MVARFRLARGRHCGAELAVRLALCSSFLYFFIFFSSRLGAKSSQELLGGSSRPTFQKLVELCKCLTHFAFIIDRLAREIIRLVASVCVCVCVCVRPFVWALSCLNRLTFDLDFWHDCRPWPWLTWNCRSRSYVKGQGQTVKIVYALPFEPVVRSRSILGMPSSANGNCEWPLVIHAVHCNCLFVSNQGPFNVSRVSGRLALFGYCLRDVAMATN